MTCIIIVDVLGKNVYVLINSFQEIRVLFLVSSVDKALLINQIVDRYIQRFDIFQILEIHHCLICVN